MSDFLALTCLLVDVSLEDTQAPKRQRYGVPSSITIEQLKVEVTEDLNTGTRDYDYKAIWLAMDKSFTLRTTSIVWNEEFQSQLTKLPDSASLAEMANHLLPEGEDWEKYCLFVVKYEKVLRHRTLSTIHEGEVVTLSSAQRVSQLIRALGSPSTDATPKRLALLQHIDNPGVIWSGRPITLQPLPLSAMHPVFGKFLQRVAVLPCSSELHEEDLVAARLFIQSSLQYYDTEQERRKAVEPYLHHFLPGHNAEITFPHPDPKKRTTTFKAGSPKLVETFSRQFGAAAVRMMLSNIEWKVECGCDLIDRGAKVYTLFCLGSEMQELRELTSLPSFIIGIVGPVIQVAGAIFVEGIPVCTPLTDLISLVNPHQSGKLPDGCPSHDDHLVWKIAHMLRSLNNCLEPLAQFYATRPSTHPLQPHPSFVKFTHQNKQYELTYTSRLDSERRASGRRAIFRASAVQAGGGEPFPVVVKFTSPYNVEAHRALDTLNIAAKLFHGEWVPDLAQYVVVMEDLKDYTLMSGLSEEGYARLRAGLQHLHDKGMVFGDLRAPNVLVQADGLPKLVDFDWSGATGTARYPTNIREDQYRDGAAGSLITEADDMAMLETYYRLFAV